MKRSKPEQTRLMLQAGMIIIVGLALFLVIYLPPYGWEATIPSAQTATGEPGIEAAAGEMIIESPLTIQQLEMYLMSLKSSTMQKDPFLSAGEMQWKEFLQELKDRPPRITGIITIEGVPVTIVEGAHYRIGDTVQNFLIGDIKENAVVFLKDGNTFTVSLTR